MVNESNETDLGVLDLTVKKSGSVLPSPPSSTSSSSPTSIAFISPTSNKRTSNTISTQPQSISTKLLRNSKRPLRFQCKFCDYKAPSTSLMQNHIYRHTDAMPYACAYCGHKSTTKSTIMVHIELCHPNMEVDIIENRVREQDFYRDLNSSDISTTSERTLEPPTKKICRSDSFENDPMPINGVAVPLKSLVEENNELSPISDQINETDDLSVSTSLPTDFIIDENDSSMDRPRIQISSNLKLKLSPSSTSFTDQTPAASKESDTEDDSEYLLVYNRPKQYYGSLYEPDKQYACRLCSYTTNHRPSMEDHVFVHTNEKPYKCGYCGEEIYTRYAATYHIKYKHTGMPRNFIQNKADVTQYYVNRAKKEEINQSKSIDTRRVKVPKTKLKSDDNRQEMAEPVSSLMNKMMASPISTKSLQQEKRQSPVSADPTVPNVQNSPIANYPFLLAWSYYLATQSTLLSPLLRLNIPNHPSATDPETARNLLQVMQAALIPTPLTAPTPAQQADRQMKKDSKSRKRSNH